MELVWQRVPHEGQRYETIGDWQLVRDTLTITTSILPNFESEIAVAVHEAVEALACFSAGITTAQVDAFDIHGEGAKLPEPGIDPRAPYHSQHMLATAIEGLVLRLFKMHPGDHDFNCDNPMKNLSVPPNTVLHFR